MGSIHDDYEEFDELNFEDVAHRRASKGRPRRGVRAAGHKPRLRPGRRYRDALDWDEVDDFDDYRDLEFDAYYRSTVDH